MESERITQGMRVVGRDGWGPDLGLVRSGQWREVVGPAVGATRRSLYFIEIEAGGASQLLSHGAEAVYFVQTGQVQLTEVLASDRRLHHLPAGALFHVAPGSSYRIDASDGPATLIGGPSPVDPTLGSTPSIPRSQPGVTTYHRDEPGLMVPFISHDARLIIWLGAGAVTANFNYVVLDPGERNKEHVHRYSEDTIHILQGRGTAENVTTGEKMPVGPGDTVQIEPGIWHAVAADRGEQMISVGGPCPADVDMLRAAGVDVDALTVSDLA